MLYFFAIGIGGSLGAVSRYLLGNFVAARSTATFPLATWLINISGSFLLGLYIGLQPGIIIDPNLEAMIILGFLSSYTTFSTFSYENLVLLQKGEYKTAAIYTISSLGLGIVAAFLGVKLLVG